MKTLGYMDRLTKLDELRIQLNAADYKLRKAFAEGTEGSDEVLNSLVQTLDSISLDATNLSRAIQGIT